MMELKILIGCLLGVIASVMVCVGAENAGKFSTLALLQESFAILVICYILHKYGDVPNYILIFSYIRFQMRIGACLSVNTNVQNNMSRNNAELCARNTYVSCLDIVSNMHGRCFEVEKLSKIIYLQFLIFLQLMECSNRLQMG